LIVPVAVLLLTASQAVELDKPEQQLPEHIELPGHIQTLITNHINHVLQTTQKPTTTTTSKTTATVITGHVPQLPHLDLLPPHVEQPKEEPQVINHQATATWQPHATAATAAPAAGHNKVVMPPVSQIVVTVGDKVNQVHEQVSHIMQQAEKHIPASINQAISEREKLNAQKKEQKTTSTTTTAKPAQERKARLLSSASSSSSEESGEEVVQVAELPEWQRELQQLGKCNFDCPAKALPVCATNGKCVVEFGGQCELSQWNCFNTKNGKCACVPSAAAPTISCASFPILVPAVFSQVHDDECRNTIRCYDRDML
ncbi:hypothetical protein KR093_010097, partial [Drosophila rubida]